MELNCSVKDEGIYSMVNIILFRPCFCTGDSSIVVSRAAADNEKFELSPSNNPTWQGLNVSKFVFQILNSSLTLSHFSASLMGAIRSIALQTHRSRLLDMCTGET